MNEKYIKASEKVSQILFEAIITKEENLKDKIFEIDTDLLSLLRAIGWKETRVAFARPVAEKKQRTFVAKMGKYPEIIQHLIGAAYDQGLFPGSQIFALC